MELVIIESPFAGAQIDPDRIAPSPHRGASWEAIFKTPDGNVSGYGDIRPVAVKNMRRAVAQVYARHAMRDCLMRGQAPYASHLLYTQPGVLDDDLPDERALGIDAGLLWGAQATRTVVYTDLGVSDGMKYGIERAEREGRPVEVRTLPGW